MESKTVNLRYGVQTGYISTIIIQIISLHIVKCVFITIKAVSGILLRKFQETTHSQNHMAYGHKQADQIVSKLFAPEHRTLQQKLNTASSQ